MKKIAAKLFLTLTFWLALHASTVQAQIFTAPLQASTTGTNPVDFEFRADGTLIAKGNYGVGSLLSGDEGAGTRMLWFPDLAAFRAGYVSGTDWNPSSIGAYSAAFGYNTTANGEYSFAAGYGSTASSYGSVALGESTTASGPESVALGDGSTASGSGSVALGALSTASGSLSVALGFGNLAYGQSSLATGMETQANGSYSASFNLDTIATSYASTAFGQYNVGLSSTNANPSATSWVATDPLFEIGNGSNAGFPYYTAVPSDAFVVYKNGTAKFQGAVTIPQSGDIPMYTGN
jgi:autotransporter adhesin